MFQLGDDGGAEQFEELVERIPKAVQDDSVESVGSAVNKTYRDEYVLRPDSPNYDPKGKERIDEAISAATTTRRGNIDNFINPHVGPGRPFKSHEEFEACLRMRAQNLTREQAQGINAIREAIGIPAKNSRLVKILDVDRARDMLRNGDPNLSGFFAERTHVDDLVTRQSTTTQYSDRLRLDRPGTPFVDGAPHVILETKMTSAIQTNAKIPRSSGYANGNPQEYVEDLPYPNGGHGFALSKDGYNVPETTTKPTAMSAGQELAVPDTILRFRFDDGTPYPQRFGNYEASDWRLTYVNANDPNAGYFWEPYP